MKDKHKNRDLTLKDVFVAADITVPVSFGAVDAANVAISGAGGFAIAWGSGVASAMGGFA